MGWIPSGEDLAMQHFQSRQMLVVRVFDREIAVAGEVCAHFFIPLTERFLLPLRYAVFGKGLVNKKVNDINILVQFILNFR